ncbi:MAG: extracellular solute-binding protein [Spirochaetaceae bacterium]|nr:extracellular solute-binding protein [Spirochaetaceae bacterium]
MKKMKKMKFLGPAVFAALALACAACSKGAAKGADKGYDVYVFNAKGENAAQFEAMAKAYQSETGVRVKTFSIGAGAEQEGPLTTEMNSASPPTIYSIQGIKRLAQWYEGGYVVDLGAVTDHPAFARLVGEIPQEMRLSSGGNTSYGIPYNIEGYGYIVDTRMLQDLFGAEARDRVLAGLQAASYAEWESFVKTLDQWIKTPEPLSVTLDGAAYTFAGTKTDMTSRLNGVFAVMGSEPWTYGDHFVNIALNAVFDTLNEALAPIADAKLQALRGPFVSYAKALDLKTSYLAGKSGPAHRGQDLVSPANFGYEQTVQIFADGKALFLKQGNWAYNNIAAVNSALAERLWFVPVKMPFTQSDLSAAGITVDRMNRSIPVFVPNYYAVNAMATDAEKKAAYDFLVWMNTSENGQRYIVEEMAFIPYNADPAKTVVPNRLGNSILSYVKSGNTLQGFFQAVPQVWPTDIFGVHIREQFLVKPLWDESDYVKIADYGVSELQKLNSAK